MFLIYVITVLSLIYFVFVKKRVDLYTLAFVSALVYFLPAFFGFTAHSVGKVRVFQAIQTNQYLIMFFVLLSIVLSSFIFDLIKNKDNRFVGDEARNKYILLFSLGVLLFSLFMMIFSMGVSNILSEDKADVLGARNRWYVLFSVVVPLYGLIAAFQKNNFHFIVSVISVLFLTFIGFRTPLMIFVLSGGLIYFSSLNRPIYKVINLKSFFASTFLIMFLFVYKKIYVQVKLGNWDVVKERLTSSELYIAAITESEPFVTQDILNSTLRYAGNIEFDFISGFLSSFMLFGDEILNTSNGFMKFVNSTLYSHIDYGVASNIWAQMYALGGWTGIIIFSIVFNSVIALFVIGMKTRFLTVKVLYANLGVLWVFALHRNDFSYLTTQQKRVVLVFVLVLFVSLFFKKMKLGSMNKVGLA